MKTGETYHHKELDKTIKIDRYLGSDQWFVWVEDKLEYEPYLGILTGAAIFEFYYKVEDK